MGGVLKLDDYREKLQSKEPGPDLTDEQVLEYVNRGHEGIKEALQYLTENAIKKLRKEIME